MAFIGCRSGQLVKMNKDGTRLVQATGGVLGCSDSAVITDRHPITKLRWLYDPPNGTIKWNGALAFNPATMQVTADVHPC